MNDVPVVASAEDLAALEAIGKEQEQKQAPGKPEDKPVADSGTSQEEPHSEGGEKQEQESEDPEDYTKRGINKRFKKLSDKLGGLEAENRQLRDLLQRANTGIASPKDEAQEPTAAVSGKPDPAKYEFGQFDPAYIEALTDWTFERREQTKRESEAKKEAEEQQKTTAQKQREWLTKASDQFEDFAEVFDATVPVSSAMAEYLLESENGAKLAYHLGQNKEDAKRIAGLGTVAAARELAKIELKIAAPEQTEKRVATKAPPPPANVGGRGGGKAFDPMDPATPYKEYERWANEQARRR